MKDRTDQPSALSAEFAERVGDPIDYAHRLRSESEKPGAHVLDDSIDRTDVVEILDRMIRDRKALVNPRSAWWVTDTAILGVLNEIRESVVELKGGE